MYRIRTSNLFKYSYIVVLESWSSCSWLLHLHIRVPVTAWGWQFLEGWGPKVQNQHWGKCSYHRGPFKQNPIKTLVRDVRATGTSIFSSGGSNRLWASSAGHMRLANILENLVLPCIALHLPDVRFFQLVHWIYPWGCWWNWFGGKALVLIVPGRYEASLAHHSGSGGGGELQGVLKWKIMKRGWRSLVTTWFKHENRQNRYAYTHCNFQKPCT